MVGSLGLYWRGEVQHVARGSIRRGILYVSRANIVDLKNACFYYAPAMKWRKGI